MPEGRPVPLPRYSRPKPTIGLKFNAFPQVGKRRMPQRTPPGTYAESRIWRGSVGVSEFALGCSWNYRYINQQIQRGLLRRMPHLEVIE